MLNMNWKEFLKPTKWKMILTVIFIFMFFILYELSIPFLSPTQDPSVICCTDIKMAETNEYCVNLVSQFNLDSIPDLCERNENIQKENALRQNIEFTGFMIITTIISYLISCIIIYTYHKVKKK